MRVVIVIPTYNERANIVALVDGVRAACTRLPHRIALLIVDDESPDGTADAVRSLQRRVPDVHLLQDRRRGLGRAYVRGLRHAVENLGADAVVQMDADFSHRPEDVPRLIAALEEGADLAIGSRYVGGGKVSHRWPLVRRLNSRFGNLLARRLLDLDSVSDCTAGFRAIRAALVHEIRLDRLRVSGFAMQVAVLHEARELGARIREIPVEYVERQLGKSKLRLSDVSEFILNALRIRLSKTALRRRPARIAIGPSVRTGAK